MIIFEKLSAKNFLGIGNNPIEISLNKTSTTLLSGTNGAGKSSCLLDTISFALFGKAHRNINKPALVNSINDKNCIVELDFSIGSKKYKIIRGLKPNIFEIYLNGNIINQESHNRDYQKILEDNILKLNYKSFHQVVVLGSGNFIPFMQLPTGQRRIVIEDLLDISVFANMNRLLKEKFAVSKNELKDLNNKIELTNTEIRLNEKHIKELKEISLKESVKNEKKRKELEKEKELLNKRNIKNVSIVTKHLPVINKKIQKKNEEYNKYKNDISQTNNEIKNTKRHHKFFSETDVCPTCEQKINSEIASLKAEEYNKKLLKLDENKKDLEIAADAKNSKINELSDAITQLKDLEENIRMNVQLISNLDKQLIVLDSEDEKVDVSKIEKIQSFLDQNKDKKENLLNEKGDLQETQEYYLAASELLRDSGIKAKIIAKYLPVMNKLINKYLNDLDLFVKLELDDTFDEVIKSRHRDVFKYSSFSEGEKARIDLAFLFTWRHIARLKNSAFTNLLILDEVFSGNLDTDGSENLMKLIYDQPKDTNTFIITHDSNLMENKFDRKIEIIKNNNFSEIKS